MVAVGEDREIGLKAVQQLRVDRDFRRGHRARLPGAPVREDGDGLSFTSVMSTPKSRRFRSRAAAGPWPPAPGKHSPRNPRTPEAVDIAVIQWPPGLRTAQSSLHDCA
ncbi:hypothetical protein GCM10023192_72760 [Amycolatopsis samaneae]